MKRDQLEGCPVTNVWLETNRWLHIAIGYIGLVAFWVPILTGKGSGVHRRAGLLFRYSGWIVVTSALLAVVLYFGRLLSAGQSPTQQPENWSFLLFLAYLAIITGLALSHGMAVLKHKRDLSGLKTPYRITLAWTGIVSSLFLIAWAIYWQPENMWVLLALSPIGLGTGIGMLKLFNTPPADPRTWLYEHLGAMIGAGIAFHTAFAVFGANQMFSYSLQGFWQVIPWVAPAAIGIPATQLWVRHYRNGGKLRAGR